ncbi:hypothetical protein OC846_000319 [Tilletia horrida]|uniref:DH domain-containing protein n=1 Tax=Tilletia horrida TaxID=155126 RepID=A0AAN6JU27_9BASI|nr:hypothetical protein OC846_000319 [Tilletia horrida]
MLFSLFSRSDSSGSRSTKASVSDSTSSQERRKRLLQKPLPQTPHISSDDRTQRVPVSTAFLGGTPPATVELSPSALSRSKTTLSKDSMSTQSTLITSSGSQGYVHSDPSSSSSSSSSSLVNPASHTQAGPEQAQEATAGDVSPPIDRAELMERMLDTPVALLSPPLEAENRSFRMRRTPSGANRHRRVKSSEYPEDYFGVIDEVKRIIESGIPSSHSLTSTAEASGRAAFDASGSAHGSSTLRGLSSLPRPPDRFSTINARTVSHSQSESTNVGLTARAGLGIWDGVTLDSPMYASVSAASSRSHLPHSQSMQGPPSISSSRGLYPPSTSSNGRMSALGRRLSSVFDNPAFLSRGRPSMTPNGPGSRSYAGSSAAPSEPNSPKTRVISMMADSESSGTLSRDSAPRSRPGSSMGFIRSTLKLDRRKSSTRGDSSKDEMMKLRNDQQTLKTGSSKAGLSLSRISSPAASKSGSVETVVMRSGSRSVSGPVSNTQTAASSHAGTVKDRISPTALTGPSRAERSPSRGRGSIQGPTRSSPHLRSPSVNALCSDRDNSSGGSTAVPSRSSLALAQLEANIEAAAARISRGVASSDWAKEVRALFVIREIIQTERSYSKHLEALIGAVRQTAAQSSPTTVTGAGIRKKGGAGLLTYSPVSTNKAGGLPEGSAPAAHLVTMKTLLPPMIVLSRSLAARMEQNPTPSGVGMAFTLLQEQIEANFVSWSRAIGSIMDALRVTESSGKAKHNRNRIGFIAPAPVMPSPLTAALGPGSIRAPERRSSLNALALTRPSSPVLLESDENQFPIWAVNPDLLSEKKPAVQPRRRSSTISLHETAALSTPPAEDGHHLPSLKNRRSRSTLDVRTTITDEAVAATKAAVRLGVVNDDLRALDTSKWEQATSEQTQVASPTSQDKNTKKGSQRTVGPGGVKMLTPQDLVIMPTQRVVRYILLLKDLLASTPGGTAHIRVERALELVTYVAEACNRVAARPTLISVTAAGSMTTASSPRSPTSKLARHLQTPTTPLTPSPTASSASVDATAATVKSRPSRRSSFAAAAVHVVPQTLKKVAR